MIEENGSEIPETVMHIPKPPTQISLPDGNELIDPHDNALQKEEPLLVDKQANENEVHSPEEQNNFLQK